MIGDRAVARWRTRIADRLRDIGGVEVAVGHDGVVVRGRRLRARWLRDARLRWLGGWM
jgi:hypothetical protein